MNVITRGIRNAFRNGVRSLSVILILGLAIGLSLIMLVANQAVEHKIQDVKSSVGNTITIQPAGFNAASEANNGLTGSELDKVKSLAHVTSLTKTLTGNVTTEGTESPMGRFGSTSDNSNATTSLKSSIDLSSINKGDGPRVFVNGSSSLPADFSPPIRVVGTTNTTTVNGNRITIKSGKTVDGTKDDNQALISTAMAAKNGLKAGSTFTAYGATLTVAGTFDSGTKGGNDTVILSLPALQRLSGQGDVVSDASATVDSVDNLASTTSAVKKTLGSNADIQNSQTEADNAVKPLQNVKQISLVSLIGAVIAGSIIIFLVMLMVVRERRREIGILKAIGASNTKVMWHFVVESITLTILAAFVGIIIGAAAAGPITNTLVDNATNSSNAVDGSGVVNGPPGAQVRNVGNGEGASKAGFVARGRGVGAIRANITNIHAAVGWSIILYGLAAAVAIALIGSALASYLIAKVRPAEVMRTE